MTGTPRVNSDGQKELKRAQEKFDNFQEQLKDFDPLNASAPVQQQESQTALSTREAKKMDAQYIKPIRSISRNNFKTDKMDSRIYWDEKNRRLHDEDWEYVRCIVENYEIIGEQVEVWTAKWACDPAHFWKIPVNKPIMIPRLLAKQLAKCQYHRLVMDNTAVREQSEVGTITGGIVADVVKNRIDARPVGFGF